MEKRTQRETETKIIKDRLIKEVFKIADQKTGILYYNSLQREAVVKQLNEVWG